MACSNPNSLHLLGGMLLLATPKQSSGGEGVGLCLRIDLAPPTHTAFRLHDPERVKSTCIDLALVCMH